MPMEGMENILEAGRMPVVKNVLSLALKKATNLLTGGVVCVTTLLAVVVGICFEVAKKI